MKTPVSWICRELCLKDLRMWMRVGISVFLLLCCLYGLSSAQDQCGSNGCRLSRDALVSFKKGVVFHAAAVPRFRQIYTQKSSRLLRGSSRSLSVVLHGVHCWWCWCCIERKKKRAESFGRRTSGHSKMHCNLSNVLSGDIDRFFSRQASMNLPDFAVKSASDPECKKSC